MSSLIVAVQLYSLRKEFEADAEGMLRKISALGYEHIELAGTYGWSPEKWQKMLQETGLKVVAAHVGIEGLTTDRAKTIEMQEAIGNHRYAVGWIPAKTKAEFQSFAKIMNKAAEDMRAQSVEVLYHNHDFEFKDVEGTTGYEILLEQTDPELVALEVDTYWVEKAGHDAVEFCEEHGDRIGLIHAKEIVRKTGTDTVVGEGDIDFPSILELAEEHDWAVIVEYEGDGAEEVVRKSAANLAKMVKDL